MQNVELIVGLAALWGGLLQWAAVRNGGSSTAQAYPALTQQPYLMLWLVGIVVLVLNQLP